MTKQQLPEYLFAVTDGEGNMMGHVAYAPGLFRDADQAFMATRAYFSALGNGDLGHGVPQIRSLPVEQMIAEMVPPVTSLEEVLVDVLYMNDCCVSAVAELPLESHVLDAEAGCKSCGTTFRFVFDAGRKCLVWRWRTPVARQRREEIVEPLGKMLALIRARAIPLADAASDDLPE